jgi:hypothetical protein
MTILNLPTFTEQTEKTPEQKLLESLQQMQIERPSVPAAEVPRFTRYGNRMAERGGFGVLPQEQLSGMTQQQVDEYERQRKQARRSGVSETLLRMGQAFQGMDASGLALERQQARQAQQQKAEQDKLLQQLGQDPRYANQIKLIQAGLDPRMFAGTPKTGSVERFSIFSNKAGRVIGTVLKTDAEGIAAVQADSDKQIVPLSAPSTSKSAVSDPLRTITKDGKVVKNVRDSELTAEEITKINQAGQVIQPLGFTEKFESGFGDISLFSKENKPLADRWQATDTLHGSLQRYTDELVKMDEAALSGVGSTATFVTGLVKNTQGFLKLASKDTQSFYNDAVAKNSFVTVEGTDFTKRLEDISNQYKINESEVRDLAYLFAAARGQEGRGLSDKDYENALNIVSGGVGKEGKIGVVQSVYNRLGDEVNNVVNNKIATLENQRTLYGAEDQRYFDIQIGQLRSLQDATPFKDFSNPLMQQPSSTTGSSNIEDILNKYPPQG